MGNTNFDPFIDGLPKAELHVHIEGTLEPALMAEMAARNGVRRAYDSVEALSAALKVTPMIKMP